MGKYKFLFIILQVRDKTAYRLARYCSFCSMRRYII